MFHRVTKPCLELSFLPNSFLKEIYIWPELVFCEREGVGGYYAEPDPDVYRILGDEVIDMKNGLVVVNALAGHDAFFVDSLAHEFRHHWQKLGGHTFQKRPDEQNWYHLADTLDYKEAIIKYFTLNWDEMDALLFSRQHADCEATEEWYGWLRRYHEDRHRSRCG